MTTFVSMENASEIFNVSIRTLRNWREQGCPGFNADGANYRVNPIEVKAWVAQRELAKANGILEQQSFQPLPRSKEDLEREILELRVQKLKREILEIARRESLLKIQESALRAQETTECVPLKIVLQNGEVIEPMCADNMKLHEIVAVSAASVSNEDDETLQTHDYALGKLFREMMFYDEAFPDYPRTGTIGIQVDGHPMTKGEPIFVTRDMSTKTVTFSLEPRDGIPAA